MIVIEIINSKCYPWYISRSDFMSLFNKTFSLFFFFAANQDIKYRLKPKWITCKLNNQEEAGNHVTGSSFFF